MASGLFSDVPQLYVDVKAEYPKSAFHRRNKQ